VSQQLLEVLNQQRRRRRLQFWCGFLAILLVGGLWAQLSKDPINEGFFDVIEAEEEIFFEDEPAVEEFEEPMEEEAPPAIEEDEAPATTVSEP